MTGQRTRFLRISLVAAFLLAVVPFAAQATDSPEVVEGDMASVVLDVPGMT